MVQRNTFVAVKFRTKSARPESVYAMDWVLCKSGKLTNGETLFFRVDDQAASDGHLFETVFEEWRKQIGSHGLIPVVIGWGTRDRDIFDYLLEHARNADFSRMVYYFDVEAFARRRIKDAKPGDGWRTLARKLGRLDDGLKKLKAPNPRAIAETMLAIDRPEVSTVIAKAFLAFLKSIMEDQIIETKEAEELRSFVHILVGDYPQFKELETELDDVLEDGVVTNEESRQLMVTLGGMQEFYERIAGVEEDK